MIRWLPRTLALAGLVLVGSVPAVAGPPTDSGRARPDDGKVPVAEGYGGAVSSVDHEATKVGIRVLQSGGNAVDAAVAAAATLGVTEPFSSGIGGGGFFVHYDAATGGVHTIDGRETAPAAATEQLFIDADTGEPLPFEEARVSGLSIGVPGTPATWARALEQWGTWSLRKAMRPAIRVAEQGFVVDETFHGMVEQNLDRFDDFTSTRELYLPGGEPPEVGSTFQNRDLARTYRILAREGMSALYRGRLGEELAATVRMPPVVEHPDLDGDARVVRQGSMTTEDLSTYQTAAPVPTHVDYRGLDVFGMGPPSSGGSTVGEALNILETLELSTMDDKSALHAYLEASAIAYADRNRYLGDAGYVDVPLEELLSQGFADERACELDLETVQEKPVDPGQPDGDYSDCGATAPSGSKPQQPGRSTTHLSVTDRWGNVVSYTFTIESTGGSGIVVPGRGYLLNNELTDFNFAPTQGSAPDPNLPAGGKRPRSSMAPTLVLEDGKPLLALGSPGGSTIITTVLQTLINRIDFGMDLPAAVEAPRVSSRNSPANTAERAFIEAPVGQALAGMGHEFTPTDEIGTVAALEFLDDGRVQAVAEPTRRGGGSAMVVQPAPPRPGEPVTH